jgi:hypothetical protein
MRLIHRLWPLVFVAVLCAVITHSLSALDDSKTQCDLNLWFGNQTIKWCSDGPPNVTIKAVNYTGGCNTFPLQGFGGVRLWVNVEKEHVQEMVGFSADNCSLDTPVIFLAEPFLKLGYCGVVCMFVMLYPIASMRVNCTTNVLE